MGMFDEVAIKCPHCGHRNLEQTKAGECTWATWDVYDRACPPEILAAVAGCHHCEECGEGYTIHIQTTVVLIPMVVVSP